MFGLNIENIFYLPLLNFDIPTAFIFCYFTPFISNFGGFHFELGFI